MTQEQLEDLKQLILQDTTIDEQTKAEALWTIINELAKQAIKEEAT